LDFTRGRRLITDGHGGFTGGRGGFTGEAGWNTRSLDKFTDGAGSITGETGFIGTLNAICFSLERKAPFWILLTEGG